MKIERVTTLRNIKRLAKIIFLNFILFLSMLNKQNLNNFLYYNISQIIINKVNIG
jgi:hypothetical protein